MEQMVSRIITSFPEWERLRNDYKEKNILISRILANLMPVATVNQTLFLTFSGKPENKKAVEEAYAKNRLELQSIFASVFGTSLVSSSEKLDQQKLFWLKELVETYSPKGVGFSIFKWKI